MATFKNITDQTHDVPLYDLHVEAGGTFEVPDDAAYSFDNQKDVWARSKTQSPDTVVDSATVDASTPAVEPAPAPAPSA